jgi:hypothetical protein
VLVLGVLSSRRLHLVRDERCELLSLSARVLSAYLTPHPAESHLEVLLNSRHNVCADLLPVDHVSSVLGVGSHGSSSVSLVVTSIDLFRRKLKTTNSGGGALEEGGGGLHGGLLVGVWWFDAGTSSWEFRGSVGGDRIKFSPEAAKNGYTIGGVREMVF